MPGVSRFVRAAVRAGTVERLAEHLVRRLKEACAQLDAMAPMCRCGHGDEMHQGGDGEACIEEGYRCPTFRRRPRRWWVQRRSKRR